MTTPLAGLPEREAAISAMRAALAASDTDPTQDVADRLLAALQQAIRAVAADPNPPRPPRLAAPYDILSRVHAKGAHGASLAAVLAVHEAMDRCLWILSVGDASEKAVAELMTSLNTPLMRFEPVHELMCWFDPVLMSEALDWAIHGRTAPLHWLMRHCGLLA